MLEGARRSGLLARAPPGFRPFVPLPPLPPDFGGAMRLFDLFTVLLRRSTLLERSTDVLDTFVVEKVRCGAAGRGAAGVLLGTLAFFGAAWGAFAGAFAPPPPCDAALPAPPAAPPVDEAAPAAFATVPPTCETCWAFSACFVLGLSSDECPTSCPARTRPPARCADGRGEATGDQPARSISRHSPVAASVGMPSRIRIERRSGSVTIVARVAQRSP